MLLVCALARHWYIVSQLRKDVERERDRAVKELKRFSGL